MSIFRIVIVLGLIGAILGGAAWFSYDFYWKPKKLDEEDRRQKAHATATPVPDYSLAAYEKAAGLQRAGDVEGARGAYAEFLRDHPNAPRSTDARAALGAINTDRLFAPTPSPGKVTHTVAKGDSLVKIAAKFKTNAELIFRVNNLETINLQIGQQLLIPQMDISITVDRAAGTVTLYNQGEFFKEYKAVSVKTPGSVAKAPVQTKVMDKIALQGANRVAFGDRTYAGSDRWVMFGAGGLVLRGLPAGGEDSPPPGIIVPAADIEEIFVLVSRGTPVTITQATP